MSKKNHNHKRKGRGGRRPANKSMVPQIINGVIKMVPRVLPLIAGQSNQNAQLLAMSGNNLPGAYGQTARSRFRAVNVDNGLRISGYDLVYKIPEEIPRYEGAVFAVIPSNPAYWTGTRIAQIAPAYMNFRPIRLQFDYIPQVAVTQQGTIVAGTLWNGSAEYEDITQTLVTSNGGVLNQVYVPTSTTIKLGTNLQQNLFTSVGTFGPNTNPFIFIAMARGAEVVPGYYMLDYEYELKNPVGTAYEFSQLMGYTLTRPEDIWDNTTAVLLDYSPDFGPGTIFTAVRTGNSVQYYYKTTPVELDLNLRFAYYFNRQGAAVNSFSTTGVSGIISITLFRYNTQDHRVILRPTNSQFLPRTAFNSNKDVFPTILLDEDHWEVFPELLAGTDRAIYPALNPKGAHWVNESGDEVDFSTEGLDTMIFEFVVNGVGMQFRSRKGYITGAGPDIWVDGKLWVEDRRVVRSRGTYESQRREFAVKRDRVTPSAETLTLVSSVTLKKP